MSAQQLRLILTESPALIRDIHACNPELSILRDFALERIADGTWNPKAQIPAHSLLAWAEMRAIEIVRTLEIWESDQTRWEAWIRKGTIPHPDNTGLLGLNRRRFQPWVAYLYATNKFRYDYAFTPRPAYLIDRGPEYPRPEGEILRELEAAEDVARWAHLMQLWTAHTGKTWSQSCQST